MYCTKKTQGTEWKYLQNLIIHRQCAKSTINRPHVAYA